METELTKKISYMIYREMILKRELEYGIITYLKKRTRKWDNKKNKKENSNMDNKKLQKEKSEMR